MTQDIAYAQSVLLKFETWLLQKILPFWDHYGWSKTHQHSYEALTSDSYVPYVTYRRSMVLARLLFVYSRAWSLWQRPHHRQRATAIYHDLTTHCWDSQNQGWFFSVTDDNMPAKDHKDLYGHAFILFGLSHYLAVFQDQTALEWMYRTQSCLQNQFRLQRGWYAWQADRHWGNKQTALNQNPHMHLLEAYLACAQADPQGEWLPYVHEGYHLFQTHLFDQKVGILREYYRDDATIDPDKGNIIEPGHQYEWVWLLEMVGALIGKTPDLEQAQVTLFNWAGHYGWDRQFGGLYNQVSDAGQPIDCEKRIWPITEYLKAAQIQTDTVDVQALSFLIEKYLTDQGTWHEFLTQDLTPRPHFLPASTLYHLFNSYYVCHTLASKS